MGNTVTRLLTPEDWQAWQRIRLEGLKNDPEAFGASYEEECNQSEVELKAFLEKSTVFGAFVSKELVGCAGFYTLDTLKKKHIGFLYGMYVNPEQRGKGIANQLVRAVIDHAKPRVFQLHLTCVTTKTAAFQLYQKHGFRVFGTEPRSLKIGDQYVDAYLMVQELD